MDFVERQEQKRRPHPRLWLSITLVWLLGGVALAGLSFVGPRFGNLRFLGFLYLAVGVASVWRWRREVHRRETWAKES
jgi:membrane protein implicated in regulation of membrane protease activity